MQIKFDHNIIVKELDDALKHLKRAENQILALKGAVTDVVKDAREKEEE